MKILVIGSGGREHALCWKIAQSKRVARLYCAPGNGGIADIAECVDIKADDIAELLNFVKTNNIDITVVGPEAALVNGIVDSFKGEERKIFGPDQVMAMLEGSKIFAKETMERFGLPTADFKAFDDANEAKAFIKEKSLPLVIKADGLCAGKGVIIAHTEKEALSAIDSLMSDKEFGPAGERILIEDCLAGEEASIILVSDGKDFILFPSSQDHKRALENDQGPNTGGMGAYSPAPVIDKILEAKIRTRVIQPIIEGLYKEGTPYKGILYIGLMIVDNEPYVLEFNVRFGDPETQAILPRLKTDLLDIIEASLNGTIGEIGVEIDKRVCVSVVCASEGYPGSYKKNLPIEGLDNALKVNDVILFHAGTKLAQNVTGAKGYETNGGRVLAVTAIANNIKQAIDRAYEAVSLIHFNGMQYRKDIGFKALERIKN
ncbi:MAG: phosphoribosylamine--glycine ligase [Candidatus Orphnella occulta]|nr:phosphoribosylamine--glycine ligase [Candidatus Orphnella occulta]